MPLPAAQSHLFFRCLPSSRQCHASQPVLLPAHGHTVSQTAYLRQLQCRQNVPLSEVPFLPYRLRQKSQSAGFLLPAKLLLFLILTPYDPVYFYTLLHADNVLPPDCQNHKQNQVPRSIPLYPSAKSRSYSEYL